MTIFAANMGLAHCAAAHSQSALSVLLTMHINEVDVSAAHGRFVGVPAMGNARQGKVAVVIVP